MTDWLATEKLLVIIKAKYSIQVQATMSFTPEMAMIIFTEKMEMIHFMARMEMIQL